MIRLAYSAPVGWVFRSSTSSRICPSSRAGTRFLLGLWHPDTNRFAVIDDEDDELDDLPLFQPNPATGLTDEIVEGVAAYLSGNTDRDMRCSGIKRFLQNVTAALRGHPG
jgi:hypothetical protein